MNINFSQLKAYKLQQELDQYLFSDNYNFGLDTLKFIKNSYLKLIKKGAKKVSKLVRDEQARKDYAKKYGFDKLPSEIAAAKDEFKNKNIREGFKKLNDVTALKEIDKSIDRNWYKNPGTKKVAEMLDNAQEKFTDTVKSDINNTIGDIKAGIEYAKRRELERRLGK